MHLRGHSGQALGAACSEADRLIQPPGQGPNLAARSRFCDVHLMCKFWYYTDYTDHTADSMT